MAGIGNYRHGHKPADGKPSGEYVAYNNMRARCTNPKAINFHRYGGRGIKVCDRWLHGEGGMSGFMCFLLDVGAKPGAGRAYQIERIDNAGNYEPGNCRWATAQAQANNRRSNRLISAFGRVRTLADWALLGGISHSTLHQRLKAGWPIERAVQQPANGQGGWPLGFPHTPEWTGEIA